MIDQNGFKTFQNYQTAAFEKIFRDHFVMYINADHSPVHLRLIEIVCQLFLNKNKDSRADSLTVNTFILPGGQMSSTLTIFPKLEKTRKLLVSFYSIAKYDKDNVETYSPITLVNRETNIS